MKATNMQVIPAPPSLMASLLAGFDAVTTHLGLLLFPIALDVFLWLGPHVGMRGLIQAFVQRMMAGQPATSPDTGQLLQANQMWQFITDHLNLMSALRFYPVGIPSLMWSRMPLAAPAPLVPPVFEVRSLLSALGLWLLLSVAGLILGSLYFGAVAYSVNPAIRERLAFFRTWPKASLQVFLLTLFIGMLLIAISIPASCIILALAQGSSMLGSLALLLYGLAVLWLLFPLIFSPHGIFIYQDSVMASMRKSVRIVRMTLPSTGMLVLAIFVISNGMDLLWASPAENSWLALVGVVGHGFITTGLLASTLIYYRNADRWIQGILANLPENPQAQLKI
ncbi:MAG: hypothetical protein ACM3PY_01975 [Omnitrophica WOR_2 bacterium]